MARSVGSGFQSLGLVQASPLSCHSPEESLSLRLIDSSDKAELFGKACFFVSQAPETQWRRMEASSQLAALDSARRCKKKPRSIVRAAKKKTRDKRKAAALFCGGSASGQGHGLSRGLWDKRFLGLNCAFCSETRRLAKAAIPSKRQGRTLPFGAVLSALGRRSKSSLHRRHPGQVN